MTLLLDLVRHGEARPAGHGGDAARRLTPRGRTDVTRLAARLRSEGVRPTHIFVSPLARARETAAILLSGRDDAPVPEIVEPLVPEAEPDEVLEVLTARDIREGYVLIVSHQPLVGRLVTFLTGGDTDFHAGTCVRITFEGEPGPRRGRLTHSIHPAGS
ncbi:MAG: phosphohistidine phosphatase SixA [Candidatus Eisenbacteria bacterium]